MKKKIALLMACVMAFGVAVGGTLAWLTDSTGPVVNTFAESDISIELEEHTYDSATDKLTTTVTTAGVSNYKMIPGWTIPKDPWATVKGGSEACYLFVKIEESGNFDTFFADYEIATGWTKYEDGVYYREVAASANDQEFSVLKGDAVTVKDTVTKADMATAKNSQPTLTFKAAAVQLYQNNTDKFAVADAYAKVVWPTTAG